MQLWRAEWRGAEQDSSAAARSAAEACRSCDQGGIAATHVGGSSCKLQKLSASRIVGHSIKELLEASTEFFTCDNYMFLGEARVTRCSIRKLQKLHNASEWHARHE